MKQLFSDPALWAITLNVVACLGILIYAKRHPAWAARWSRMLPTCARCGAALAADEDVRCTTCEINDSAEINPYTDR